VSDTSQPPQPPNPGYYQQPPGTAGSAAPSTWGNAPPTGSNVPGTNAANAPGGQQPGRP
jgi:hypothetical protein